jgi:ABC-type uncharacterized transport system involved in gliding motility auxiliary subunit
MAQRKQFVSYLVNRFAVQTVLVVAIVVFGFLAVEEMVVRWDLTEDQRFSLSPASHKLAASLEDPLTIRAYFSNNIPERLVPLQRQVFDVLDEYEAHGEGKIKVERYDPIESRAAESEAQTYGIKPVNLSVYEATQASTIQVFGSIVLLYRDRASEVIDIAERYAGGYEGLSILEYEISSKIWQLTHDKPKLGLCGYLTSPPPSQFPGMPPRGQPQPRFNGLRRLLGDAFEVEEIDLDQEEPKPSEMPLLLVVRPKDFSDVAVFRLDQYLCKGGRVLMFITEGEISEGPAPPSSRQRGQFTYKPFKTGLDKWLAHNGLRVPNEFVLHKRNAPEIPIMQVKDVPGIGRVVGPFPEPNWFWPLFGLEGTFDEGNPAVQNLRGVTLFWPHPVDVLEDKLDGKTATVLMRSHAKESWRWKDLNKIDRRHLDGQLDSPDPSEFMSSPVAVAVEGRFHSYFADKPVPPSLTGGDKKDKDDEAEAPENGGGEDGGAEDGEGEEKKEDEPSTPDVVEESPPTQLVVVGNSFFISDFLLGGQQADDRSKLAGLLAFNLVDWLARSKDLIALRAKKYTNRALKDPDFDDDIDELNEQYDKQEINVEEYKEKMEGLQERQKNRWKRWRWINVLVPCLVVFVVGALVWIVRGARRAGKARVPAAHPPESVDREG